MFIFTVSNLTSQLIPFQIITVQMLVRLATTNNPVLETMNTTLEKLKVCSIKSCIQYGVTIWLGCQASNYKDSSMQIIVLLNMNGQTKTLTIIP